MIDKWLDTVQQGDCIEVMRGFPAESINLVMFSPPYWGLRDYGIDGQIGLEPTYQEYVAKMVEVGREVRRVLRSDGSWYLNLGDTYLGDSKVRTKGSEAFEQAGDKGYEDWLAENRELTGKVRRSAESQDGIKAKCKLLIPYRVALALVDDGWTCRNDITWFKPNAMPSSVKDRLTCQTERVFHLVKSRKYYYDLDAIREPHSEATIKRVTQPTVLEQQGGAKQDMLNPITGAGGNYNRPAEMVKSIARDPSLGKNPGDVIKSAHTKGDNPRDYDRFKLHGFGGVPTHPLGRNPGDFWPITTKPFPEAHFAVYPEALCERPIKSSCPKDGIVLDPMCGAGTTLAVAKKLGRRHIGIDLNRDYVKMAQFRLSRIEWPLDHFAGERSILG